MNGARNLDARTMFYYAYTVVTPAMAVTVPGRGSDYAMAFKKPIGEDALLAAVAQAVGGSLPNG